MDYDSYLIERAVSENKPELITEHPLFSISLLNNTGNCLMQDIRDEESTDDEGEFIGFADCGSLDCNDCPFYIYNKEKLDEAMEWLKLNEPKSIYDYQYNF